MKKGLAKKTFVLVFIMVFSLLSIKNYAQAQTKSTVPANPNASGDTRQLYHYIATLPQRSENRVISGQHLGSPAEINRRYRELVDFLYGGGRYSDRHFTGTGCGWDEFQGTGKWVAMIGVDYGPGWENTTIEDIITANNEVLIPWWNNGGLITIYLHPHNPWTDGMHKGVEYTDLRELVDPNLNPTVYSRWRNTLDMYAAGLTHLRDAGVVVLWRPLHEMNYRDLNWYGFGAHPYDPEPYKNVWIDMFNYFTYEKGLDNLLWVYGPANRPDCPTPRDWCVPIDYMYPGGAYVDIVGQSTYSNSATVRGSNYENLLALGKPYAFTESGPDFNSDLVRCTQDSCTMYDNTITINSIVNNYPETIYFLAWSSWWDWTTDPITDICVAIIDCRNPGELLSHPWVITREELAWQEGVSSSSIPGDLNQDGIVDISDFNQLVSDFGWTGNPGSIPSDIDKDGVVDIFDFNILVTNFTG